jgi:hypothetical protein
MCWNMKGIRVSGAVNLENCDQDACFGGMLRFFAMKNSCFAISDKRGRISPA